MKNITKRKDGRWQAYFTHNKKRYFIYDTNKKTCYKKLIELKTKLTGESPKHRENPKTNFFDFAKMWYEKFKKNNIKDSTKEMYLNCINKHLSKINEDFKDITTLKLQNFLNKLGNTRTKEITYICLKQIFKKAKELEIIQKDPTEYLTKGKIVKKERLNLNLQEQKTILANLNQQDKFSQLILFYLLTGARRNEALYLPIKNITKEYVLIEGTKTKNAFRYVKVSEKLSQMLLKNQNETLFEYSEKYVEKKFRNFCKNIEIKATIHQLRHTYSTNLYYLGAKDKERQVFLGHSSSILTNDIYTHLDPTITKEDIVNLYKGFYPTFWHHFWHHILANLKTCKKKEYNI